MRRLPTILFLGIAGACSESEPAWKTGITWMEENDENNHWTEENREAIESAITKNEAAMNRLLLPFVAELCYDGDRGRIYKVASCSTEDGKKLSPGECTGAWHPDMKPHVPPCPETLTVKLVNRMRPMSEWNRVDP